MSSNDIKLINSMTNYNMQINRDLLLALPILGAEAIFCWSMTCWLSWCVTYWLSSPLWWPVLFHGDTVDELSVTDVIFRRKLLYLFESLSGSSSIERETLKEESWNMQKNTALMDFFVKLMNFLIERVSLKNSTTQIS